MTLKNENITQRKPRILLVDDNRSELMMLSDFLSGYDYHLKTTGSALEGLEIAKTFLPDIIVSDVVMPDMDGFEFCRLIKNDTSYSGTIFILASGYAEEKGTLKGVDAGADDYLNKPFKKNEFTAKIKAFLRIRFLQDDLARTNRKLNKALRILKEYKTELEAKNNALTQEKEMIQNSLKQISLMASEREKTNIELERLNQLHQQNIDGLISILSSFIESKRQYHRGHSKKVAEISSFLARELKLPDMTIHGIETAALLHELGKLSIPEELAMKNPEEYTRQEKDFLSRHPGQGASILEQFSGFEDVAEIIKHLHENIDGTGIPDGLEGDDIPIGSRIIALANIFENLVYRRKDIDTKTAFETIEEKMGSRLDPTLWPLMHKYAHQHPVNEEVTVLELRLLELEPGMKLAGGIFTASGTKLLPIGTVLTESAINQVVQYNKLEPVVETVYVVS